LARASSSTKIDHDAVEQCWLLVGQRRGPIWYARRVRRSSGERASVHFDGLWALRREESHHDVVGFYHTHPDGPACPSQRDERTMRAWCSAFGKPLLCVIASPGSLNGFRFDDDESDGVELLVETFSRGVVIGVEADGRQVSS